MQLLVKHMYFRCAFFVGTNIKIIITIKILLITHPLIKLKLLKLLVQCLLVGQDTVVSIATHYGLEDPGIESRWGRDFPQLSRPALGSTQPPVQCVPGLSRG
jgi:hypothetical protein